MKISEKQLIRLLQLFSLAIDYNLSNDNLEESFLLINDINNQQSEELNDIE